MRWKTRKTSRGGLCCLRGPLRNLKLQMGVKTVAVAIASMLRLLLLKICHAHVAEEVVAHRECAQVNTQEKYASKICKQNKSLTRKLEKNIKAKYTSKIYKQHKIYKQSIQAQYTSRRSRENAQGTYLSKIPKYNVRTSSKHCAKCARYPSKCAAVKMCKQNMQAKYASKICKQNMQANYTSQIYKQKICICKIYQQNMQEQNMHMQTQDIQARFPSTTCRQNKCVLIQATYVNEMSSILHEQVVNTRKQNVRKMYKQMCK